MMSDVMLHGVLNIPPELWIDSDIDKMQRYYRYMEASRRIEDLERALQILVNSNNNWTLSISDNEEALISKLLANIDQ